MANANRTWCEERIAELQLKLGISVSSRTVRRYMHRPSRPQGPRSQVWSTFVRNHARAMLACDLFVTVTATFQLLYVFVVLDVGCVDLVLQWFSRPLIPAGTRCSGAN